MTTEEAIKQMDEAVVCDLEIEDITAWQHVKDALAAATARAERAERERDSAIVACYMWRDRRNLPSEEIVPVLASMCGMSQKNIEAIVFPPAANLDAPAPTDPHD